MPPAETPPTPPLCPDPPPQALRRTQLHAAVPWSPPPSRGAEHHARRRAGHVEGASRPPASSPTPGGRWRPWASALANHARAMMEHPRPFSVPAHARPHASNAGRKVMCGGRNELSRIEERMLTETHFFFLIETIFFFGAYGYERPKKTIFIQTIYISCIYPSFKSEFMTSGIHYMVIINGG